MLIGVLAAGVLVTMMPFMYMVSTAFTRYAFTLPYPPRLIPADPTIENFVRALTTHNLPKYAVNSIYITLLAVVGVVFGASLTAYGFARFQFPGKEILFRVMIFTLMVPGMVRLIPTFLVMRDLHLLDSRTGVAVLMIAFGLAGNTFMLRQFFESIPRELEEAVRVDGGGSWTVYRHVVLPLSQPALATVGIMTFMGVWDDYFWSLTLLKDEANRTLPIAIRMFQTQFGTNFSLVFAASIIALIPSLLFFVFGQKYFVQGLSQGSLKG